MTQKPQALKLADDRPWQQGDDLYSWAIDAEDMLRSLYAENHALREQNTALNAACAKLEAQRDELLEALNRMVCNPNAPNLAFARAAIAKCR